MTKTLDDYLVAVYKAAPGFAASIQETAQRNLDMTRSAFSAAFRAKYGFDAH